MEAFHQGKQGMSLFLPHLSSGSDLVLNPVYIHGFSACSNLVVLLLLSICCGCNRVRKASVSSHSNQKSSFLLYKPTLLACMGLSSFYLVICVLNYFFWYRNGWADEKLVTQLDFGLRTLAWVAIFVYLYTHFSNSSERKFPLWLRVWWGVFFLMSASSLTIDLVRHQKHQSLQTHFWVLDVVGLFFLCTGIYGKRVEKSLLEEPLLNLRNSCIFRAPMSFFDSTASVDTATDNLIQITLRQHFSDSTVVTIAHRITSVLDSDMVLLLDHGLIAEYDSPGKLLKNKTSSFAKLVAEYTVRSTSSF